LISDEDIDSYKEKKKKAKKKKKKKAKIDLFNLTTIAKLIERSSSIISLVNLEFIEENLLCFLKSFNIDFNDAL